MAIAHACFNSSGILLSKSVSVPLSTNRNGRKPSKIAHHDFENSMMKIASHFKSGCILNQHHSFHAIRCNGRFRMQNSDDNSTESLFQRELKKRGISSKPSSKQSQSQNQKESSSSAEETSDSNFGNSKRVKPPPGWSTDETSGQLERSRALNSEGLEGLIPRASELIKLGASFSASFFPLALVFVAIFVSVYLYFGQGFIHAGQKFSSVPQYIDPYELLLEEEKLNKRVPYNYNNKNNYNDDIDF